jgi:hypothetical protein
MMNPTSSVSVYVLRERLHETWEKRESIRREEEDILRTVVAGSPLESYNGSLSEKALDAIVEGTEGYDNLQSWRSRFLNKNN